MVVRLCEEHAYGWEQEGYPEKYEIVFKSECEVCKPILFPSGSDRLLDG